MGASLRRGALTGALLAVFLMAFRGVELLVHPRFSLETPLDRVIPFIPASIFIYQAFFFWVLGAALWVSDEAALYTMMRQMALAVGIGLICFLVFPAAMTRPDVYSIGSDFIRQRFLKLWALDSPHNTFPSLHVAVTWIVAAALRREGARVAAQVPAALITFSTLTVKQHALADVAGGALLCVLVCKVEPGLRGLWATSHQRVPSVRGRGGLSPRV